MPNSYQYVAPTRSVGQVSSLIAGNRLEPRPRSTEFNRSLRAEVRDASWLLARQWQMKEFRAEDRGSPIKAQVDLQHAPLTQLRLGDATSVTAYDRMALPLDAVVQAEPPTVDVALQLQMGRHWKRLLQNKLPAAQVSTAQISSLLATYRNLFPITAPTPNLALPYDLDYALEQTEPEAFAVRTAVAGHAIAGYELYTWLIDRNHSTAAFLNLTAAAGLTTPQQTALGNLATEFIAWFRRAYSIPSTPANAWSVPDLAYKFAAAAPAAGTNPVVVKTTEHFGEELNWYTVDEDTTGVSSGFQNTSQPPSPQTLHFVPTEIQFPGAPNARWWEFEDRKIDFGRITGDSSDFGRMLLQEFMFLYTNDWFSLPYTVPAGSICSVNHLLVTDVFGEQYRIQPAGQNTNLEPTRTNVPLENDWGRWSLFGLSRIGNRDSSAPRLLLPPTALNTQVGPTVEQVYFAREEATNLVWGVEKIIPNGMGRGTDGDSAAARVADFLRSKAQPKPMASGAELEYKLATAVAENWIPFIPRPTNNLYELEQGAMLRHVDYLKLNTGDETVQPRTSLLGRPANVPYLVHEREIPPTGMRLEGSFRRTRWYNGGAVLWYGRNRNVGRSGGSSGLAYDQLFNRPPSTGTSTGGSSTAASAPALGVVSVNRTSSGTIASVQAYRLDAQNKPTGNLIEYSGEQLVDLILNEQSVVVIQSNGAEQWSTASTLSAVAEGNSYTIQETVFEDPLVKAHRERVGQAGGQFLDETYLAELVALLRQLGLTDKIMHLSDVRLGSLVNEAGRVTQLFCLGGHDAVAVDLESLPQWDEAGLNGKPIIHFEKTGLVVEDFDFSQSDTYTAVTLVRQIRDDNTGYIVACQPNNADGFMIMPQYGYMRCRHVVNYTGQDLIVNDGTGYEGGWLTIAARYDLARVESQLMGNFYSFRLKQSNEMGYAYNNARDRRLEKSPLYLGSTNDGGLVGAYFFRDYDDEKGMNLLRDFMQTGYTE